MLLLQICFLLSFAPFLIDRFSNLPIQNAQAGESPQVFAEVRGLTSQDDRKSIDDFASYLKSNRGFTGYIISYAGRVARPDEARQQGSEIYGYLLGEKNVRQRQLMLLEGGFRDNASIELFLREPYQDEPNPSRTIDPDEVEFIYDNPLFDSAVLRKQDELLETTTNRAEAKYPPLARAARIVGQVGVMVIIDEEGRVIATQIMYGHPLLRESAESAAQEWRFKPMGNQVKGLIKFDFVLPTL